MRYQWNRKRLARDIFGKCMGNFLMFNDARISNIEMMELLDMSNQALGRYAKDDVFLNYAYETFGLQYVQSEMNSRRTFWTLDLAKVEEIFNQKLNKGEDAK